MFCSVLILYIQRRGNKDFLKPNGFFLAMQQRNPLVKSLEGEVKEKVTYCEKKKKKKEKTENENNNITIP